jgi:hypothetical protein
MLLVMDLFSLLSPMSLRHMLLLIHDRPIFTKGCEVHDWREVAQLLELWHSKVMAISSIGPGTKNDCVSEDSSNFSEWPTKVGLWLIHRLAHIHSCLVNWTMDLMNYPDLSTENGLVLQVCMLHDARKNVVPAMPYAFECCWHTCEQTFNSSQLYFSHVETHVYCNPHGRIVKGGVSCRWRGEF